MRTKYLIIVLIILALTLPASPALAGGVVTVCDEAHLLAALAGGGTVTFACSGVITLTGQIVISADSTIDASGRAVTLRGSYPHRVLKIMPGVAVALTHLTVTDGYAETDGARGGAIYNDGGTLNVIDCAFTDNGAYSDGGAIYNTDGSVTVENSTFSHNGAHYAGGAIYNSDGTVVVRRSTLENNGTGYGGGAIYNYHGVVNVRSSTFSGNLSGAGGGISNGGALTVSNCTFIGNSADGFDGGAGIYTYHTATVVNSTFAGNSAGGSNGAGIQNDGTATLKNTIVADSASGNNCAGAIIDGGGNLSYPDTTCPGINGDPLLGPLQNNIGPTETMALGPGSAAIDAGNDTVCAANPVNNLDQRGIARPHGAHCDIGAVEQVPVMKAWLPSLRLR